MSFSLYPMLFILYIHPNFPLQEPVQYPKQPALHPPEIPENLSPSCLCQCLNLPLDHSSFCLYFTLTGNLHSPKDYQTISCIHDNCMSKQQMINNILLTDYNHSTVLLYGLVLLLKQRASVLKNNCPQSINEITERRLNHEDSDLLN